MAPSGAINLSVSHTPALITIVNDDAIPTIAIQDWRQVGVDDDHDPITPPIYDENAPGQFVVTLSNPSQYAVTVQWRTNVATTFQGSNPDDAATPFGFPDPDFVMSSGTLTFAPGVTTQLIKVVPSGGPPVPNSIVVMDDSLDENEESFFVELYNPSYADIADERGYGFIADDDAPVSAYILPLTPIDAAHPFTTQVTEGNGGSTPVPFRVWLSAPSGKVVTVTWATSPGTAVESVFSGSTDPVDYVSTPNDSTLPELATLVFQ